jgi:putative membrane protein
MRRAIKFLVVAGTVWLCAEYFSGVFVESYLHAIYVAVVLAISNFFIKPFLHLISLPVTILTFGLFCFVINATMVMITDAFLQGFSVDSFWWALTMSIVISFMDTSADKMLYPEKYKKEETNA